MPKCNNCDSPECRICNPPPPDRARAIIEGLEEDAIQVLEAVAERLRLGQRTHGILKLDGDKRDWHREAADEALDLSVYMACHLLQLRRGIK